MLFTQKRRIQTPGFISPDEQQPHSPDLTSVDYCVWSIVQEIFTPKCKNHKRRSTTAVCSAVVVAAQSLHCCSRWLAAPPTEHVPVALMKRTLWTCYESEDDDDDVCNWHDVVLATLVWFLSELSVTAVL